MNKRLYNCKMYLILFDEQEYVKGFWQDIQLKNRGVFTSYNYDTGACRSYWEDVSSRGICNHFKG